MKATVRDDWTQYAVQDGLLQAAPDEAPPRSKYGAVKETVDGIVFASKKEAARYVELTHLVAAGLIDQPELQPVFPLHVMELWRSQVPIVITTIGVYKADFRYRDLQTGEIVVEDVKSGPTKTEAYRLRKRVAEAVHGMCVREV